jgi:hypothetical protein
MKKAPPQFVTGGRACAIPELAAGWKHGIIAQSARRRDNFVFCMQ